MKLKQNFVLREVAGEYIVIPVTGMDDKFKGIMTLNETGAFIWRGIEAGKEKTEIVADLCEEYEVSEEKATQNVEDFCAQLEKLEIL